MTTVKAVLRCKLDVDEKIIQEKMKFNLLGIEISGYGNVEAKVRQHRDRD